jgi:hypothetical protein
MCCYRVANVSVKWNNFERAKPPMCRKLLFSEQIIIHRLLCHGNRRLCAGNYYLQSKLLCTGYVNAQGGLARIPVCRKSLGNRRLCVGNYYLQSKLLFTGYMNAQSGLTRTPATNSCHTAKVSQPPTPLTVLIN